MGNGGALEGVKVVDLTGDLGRFATKLLAEAGSSVVRVGRRGSSGRPMVDAAAAARGGVLDWWYEGGKEWVDLDPARRSDARELGRLVRSADLVIDDLAPGLLAEYGLDHFQVAADHPALVHVSLTPFGRTGPRAGWATSDLVAGALGGVCSLGGLPDFPLNSWGRQNLNFGGFVAAVSALAALRHARHTGVGQHVDVSLHEVVTGSIENLFMQYWYDDILDLVKEPARQAALHWLGLYDVAPARSGAVMITPTPTPQLLVDWMLEDGLVDSVVFDGMEVEEILERREEFMAVVRTFVARHDASELFAESPGRHVALGEVQTPAQAATNPQFAHRGFYQPVRWDGPELLRPASLARLQGTPAPSPAPPPLEPTPLNDVMADWGAGDARPRSSPSEADPTTAPLAGVRIVDFTWVLAGPFCTRTLGDLGADVMKLQHEPRATLVNRDDYPYYAVWNRSKRSALINMRHPEALGPVRKLIEQADVLIENYSAGVLDSWGLDWDTVSSWNPRLIYVTMSGCGHHGPWRDVISYAPTIHALCGLTYLTNPPERRDVGVGFSLNDHAAGFTAALMILEALEARERTGQGQLIDLAQLEVGSYLIGPALIDEMANGRSATPDGNTDGLDIVEPNGIFLAADHEWVAVTADDDQWPRLARAMDRADLADRPDLASASGRRAQATTVRRSLADWCLTRRAHEVMDLLQGQGVPAGVVQGARGLMADPQHQARGFWQQVNGHPHFGDRPADRFPARFSESDLLPHRRSPTFAEHAFEIWGGVAGLSDEEIVTGMGSGLFE
ncbi:MAG: CoA transferase [Actinomycetia bacterium]|nr:CoA transferase [Actinomycetes bacterium]